MIRFDNIPPEIMQAMITPMHLIPLPPSSSSSSQQTLPGHLYLGSLSALQDPTLLRHHRITHLVQVLDVPWLPLSEKDGYTCYKIPVGDEETVDLRPFLENVCSWIWEVLRGGGNVLVHCQQGISRSPAIIIAYLMRFHRMSYASASSYVLKTRACIKPNKGFVRTLQEWETIVANGGYNAAAAGGSGAQRPGMGSRRFTT
ncbi:phosphatases II [Agrocybe pediades]|nr:phosphatases II [Agrocybe pediades]